MELAGGCHLFFILPFADKMTKISHEHKDRRTPLKVNMRLELFGSVQGIYYYLSPLQNHLYSYLNMSNDVIIDFGIDHLIKI